jgi:hypothetical protein
VRIAVVFRADYYQGKPVPAYPWSYVDAFCEMGHHVTVFGEGHPGASDPDPSQFDLLLEIENGRNDKGELRFQHAEKRYGIESAVLLYDTHGQPDLHQAIAQKYHHVFFGSWVKRGLFADHKSAHWCPSATDLKWFGTPEQLATEPTIDVGFFGSKRGLERAKDLVEICKRNGWTYDVRQIASNRRVRWPATGNAMAKCRVLFNRGQKHDGPNQRVMESMAMGRPLLTDLDERDGMQKLFRPYVDYYPYTPETLGPALELLCNEKREGVSVAGMPQGMAGNARRAVEAKHTIKHRARQILEVVTK